MTDPGPRRRSRRAVLAGLAAGASALAGCGYRPGGGDVRWRRDEATGLAADHVDVAGDTLYAVDSSAGVLDAGTGEFVDGAEMAAYRTRDGRERWSESFEAETAATAVGPGGAAVAVGGGVRLYGPDGRRWVTSVDGPVRSLAVGDGRVYALTEGPTVDVFADGVRTGGRSLDADRREGVGRSEGPLAAGPGFAVVGGDAATAVAPDGTVRWRLDRATAAVTVTDDAVFAVLGRVEPERGERFALAALSPSTGAVRWSVGVGTRASPPIVTADTVYHVGVDTLVAVSDGRSRWSVGVYRDGDGHHVAADDTGVYAVTVDGLTAFDPDGTRRWTVEHDEIWSGPFATDGGIEVVVDGDLVCHVR